METRGAADAMNILHGIAIGLDYGLEMICFWRRAEPMTISSQAGLALRRGEHTPLTWFGKLLNWVSTGHTEAAISADRERLAKALMELTK